MGLNQESFDRQPSSRRLRQASAGELAELSPAETGLDIVLGSARGGPLYSGAPRAPAPEIVGGRYRLLDGVRSSGRAEQYPAQAQAFQAPKTSAFSTRSPDLPDWSRTIERLTSRKCRALQLRLALA